MKGRSKKQMPGLRKKNFSWLKRRNKLLSLRDIIPF